MKKLNTKLWGPLLGALVLTISGCSTIGSAVDAINPFDKTEADKLKAQGDVAGRKRGSCYAKTDHRRPA